MIGVKRNRNTLKRMWRACFMTGVTFFVDWGFHNGCKNS